VRLVIEGHDLPGRQCGGHVDVHVGVQLGREPAELVTADAPDARWELDIEVIETPHGTDFRGTAVQGKKGERFVYLTWGEGAGDRFTMFRRAKLMLGDLPAPAADVVTARVHLTDELGLPRCARLEPPAVAWS
jgi:hypothetical protein